MFVRDITTYTSARYPHLMWVEVTSGDGLVGFGETYYWPSAAAAYIHEAIAPILLEGKSIALEELVQLFLRNRLNSGRMSLETRAFSAIETALVDIEAQRRKQTLVEWLGGAVRDSMRVYNTGGSRFALRDLPSFLLELKAQGVTAFKITPFHHFAERTRGTYMRRADLVEARSGLRALREAVGDDVDLMIELGCRWQPYGAAQICKLLNEFDLLWIEDPIVLDSPQSLGALRKISTNPFAVSEYVATMHGLTEYYRSEAVDVVMIDVSWVGGVHEARKVAAIAESHRKPVTFHDFTGPLAYVLGSHMSSVVPNVLIQESATDFYSTWYAEVVTALPELQQGFVSPPRGLGVGTTLTDLLKRASDTTRRSSTASSATSRWAVMDALGYIYAQSNLLHLNATGSGAESAD